MSKPILLPFAGWDPECATSTTQSSSPRRRGPSEYSHRVAGAVARPSSHTTVRTVPYTAVQTEVL
ncbi:MAG: hypothetical protein JXX14_16215, partial [Deltaproteobacteria bacterium]|nr:hypothetical protein [Deltaproteobacteria bacterium]